MMKKRIILGNIQKTKAFLKQILIILTLLVLTSCSIFSLAHTICKSAR